MRALAELVMQGRKQAAFVAVIAALLPLLYWISAATVALVTLRKGTKDGAGVLVWAILPAGAWAYSGDPTPLAVIVGVFALSIALRETANWTKVLLLALVVGAFGGIALEFVLGDLLSQIVTETEKFLQQSGRESRLDKENFTNLLSGGLMSVHTAMMLLSLILARSWQAGLYNPGGFQQEFHQLRLPLGYTGALLLVCIACYQLELDFMRWLPLLLLPWIFAGIALMHGSLAKRDLGKPWLVTLYMSIVLAGPYVITLLIFAAVIDSFIDIRARIPAKN